MPGFEPTSEELHQTGTFEGCATDWATALRPRLDKFVFHFHNFSLFSVYLLIGVTVMTLTLSVIYSVPEFDMTSFFLISCASGNSGIGLPGANGSGNGNGSSGDPERIRLHSSGSAGPLYTQQQDERSSLVRFKSPYYGRKHSCFPPSSPGFESWPRRDFFSLLLSWWTVLRSNPSSAQ